jgi:catechol 2,3-dioxygenase-like lactoylglutathione lyase family enzyme
VFDHVGIRVSDREASRRFYDTVLAPLGYAITHSTAEYDEWYDFGIAEVRGDRPASRGLHVAFVARSREEVDAFWRAGSEAGYASDGAPGPRPEYTPDYYGGFLLDPDGHSAEAAYLGRPRQGPNYVDHLWIRVADLEASRRFWETVAPTLDLRIAGERPGRFHVAADDRSFALVRGGEPTRNVHVAFPAETDEAVEEFHRAALAAGYRDNGAPGERPEYHAGYYGAFVLDPDGNNVEAVNHNQ